MIKVILLTSRPLFWGGAFFIYLAGTMAGSLNNLPLFVLGSIWVTFIMGLFIYGWNDLADRESDLRNKRKGTWEGYVAKDSRELLLIRNISIFSFIVPLILFLIFKFYLSALMILGIGLFSYLYSVKPFRLKSVPVLDSLSNGAWLVMTFLFGFGLNYSESLNFPRIPFMVVVLFLGIFAAHALGAMVDFEEDIKNKDTTIATLLNKRGVLVMCSLIYLFLWRILPLGLPFIQLFLYLAIGSCVVMFILNKKIILHHLTIFLYVLFPICCLVTLIFNYNAFTEFLKLSI